MVARRSMYSVRTECKIEHGETDFANPVAPFVLNLLIQLFRKVQASSISPGEKLALFSALSMYNVGANLLVFNANMDARGQEFTNRPAELGPAQDANIEQLRLRADWAQACLYYMHMMLAWKNKPYSPLGGTHGNDQGYGEKSDLYRDLFNLICIRVKWNKPTRWGNASRKYVNAFRAQIAAVHEQAYQPGHTIHDGWEDRTRFANLSINHAEGANRVVYHLSYDFDTPDKVVSIKPQNMYEWIPWGSSLNFEQEDGAFAQLLEEFGGIEQLISATHQFHRAACEGIIGPEIQSKMRSFSPGPAGILEFLQMRTYNPREFDVPDYENPDSPLYNNWFDVDGFWAAAFRKYQNSLGSRDARLLLQNSTTIREEHFRLSALHAIEEQTVVELGKVEDILLKMDYEMYRFVFYDKRSQAHTRPGNDYHLIKYLAESNLIAEEELQRARSGETHRKENYTNLVKKLLYVSRDQVTYGPFYKLRNLGIGAQSCLNMKTRYLAGLNDSTGIDQALSAAVFDTALLGVKQGLLRTSEVKQICRFISNVPCNPLDRFGSEHHGAGHRAEEVTRTARSEMMRRPSEELRSGFMPTRIGPDSDNQVVTQNTPGFLSVPLAQTEAVISPLGEVMINCWPLSAFKEKYHMRQRSMADRLLYSQGEVKSLLQYIFPVRRFQAIATMYTTAALSGYSGMPSILQTPKHNLAFLLKASGLNTKQRNEFFNNYSQAESMKAMMDNPISNPDNLDCFDIGVPTEFFENFKDMLKDLIKYFPSALFRGIASTVDPSYQEMKTHWENCNIENLSWNGIRLKSADRRSMTAGLQRKSSDHQGKYSPVITSFGRDLVYSIGKLLDFEGAPMKRTLERFTGYMYKGPVALMDGIFAFSLPCMEYEESWPGESPAPWNADRYGHPLSPFTVLALSTYQLPGEQKLRQRSGACNEVPALYTPEHMQDRVCRDREPSPFGPMPKSEDFIE